MGIDYGLGIGMRRIAGLLVLAGVTLACALPMRAQQMSVAEYNRKSAQAGKKQEKDRAKAAKNQQKAQKKAQKTQAKQLKKDRASDAKANRTLH
jgi:regulator of protease activity HflC (stomatin/prohibitin superfamily)